MCGFGRRSERVENTNDCESSQVQTLFVSAVSKTDNFQMDKVKIADSGYSRYEMRFKTIIALY